MQENEDISKTINLEIYFKEYDERLDWLKETSARLVEINREYEEKFPKLLQKAIEDNVDFKALYGGNTEKTRKKYVDEQLSELILEKEKLELFKSDDIRRVEFLKKIIDMDIALLKFL